MPQFREYNYVHYGAGKIVPEDWMNFDISPTLRIQKVPILGKWLARKFQGFNFPDHLKYGDIVKGLPLPAGSCAGVYCSHVIEHLTREQAERALRNIWNLLH